MILRETPLAGAYVLELEQLADERGHFARTFDAELFIAHGLDGRVAQCNTSFNAHAGTLRGMHYQAAPHEEEKLVRCTSGAIFDVIVDIREGSATRHRWLGIELTARNRRAVFVPKGFAHGFISLTVGSEVLYMISEPHAPAFGRGIRWNDPVLGIEWPLAPTVMSARDAHYPSLDASPAA